MTSPVLFRGGVVDRDLAELSIVRSDLIDLKEYGGIRWRTDTEAAKKLLEAADPADPAK